MLRPEIKSQLSIAGRAEVTGVGWRSLSRFYDLPADLHRLRVLDLCAGMSDLAYRLPERGADAYALDILYGDRCIRSTMRSEPYLPLPSADSSIQLTLF